MTFGLIGYPLSHSFSRGYFTEKFAELGLADTHQYLNFAMEDITGYCDLRTKYPDLRGVNVTIPHKRAIIPLLDELDPAAARIGAVNCVKIETDGTARGFNTDYLGFREDFLDGIRAQKWVEKAFGLPATEELLETFLAESNALILGTGGASLAVREALQSLGIQTRYVSRTPGEDRFTYAELTAADIADHLIIVNTTPLGMAPKVDTFPELPYAAIGRAHFCYDIVYNPPVTTFLHRVLDQGASIRNGQGMLERQAEAGWDIWQ